MDNTISEEYYLLSHEDKTKYDGLKLSIMQQSFKNQKKNRIKKTFEMLDFIRHFCEYEIENRNIRYLVCGICWLDNGIAVNNQRLCELTNRCKSSLNELFSKADYISNPFNSLNQRELLEKIPFLKENPKEIKKWTYRIKIQKKTPKPKDSFDISYLNDEQFFFDDVMSNEEDDAKIPPKLFFYNPL